MTSAARFTGDAGRWSSAYRSMPGPTFYR
jgi:hypothetical protein